MSDDCPPPRPPITKEDAQLIAKEVLAEVSSNISKYVGRGVLAMFGKAMVLILVAIALWGWAYMAHVSPTTPSHTAGH